jgi:hypothetical protein
MAATNQVMLPFMCTASVGPLARGCASAKGTPGVQYGIMLLPIVPTGGKCRHDAAPYGMQQHSPAAADEAPARAAQRAAGHPVVGCTGAPGDRLVAPGGVVAAQALLSRLVVVVEQT